MSSTLDGNATSTQPASGKTASGKRAIAFIHGLWLHAESWNNWINFFEEKGYHAVGVNWPGDSATTEATREHADDVAGYGVSEIADFIAEELKQFDEQPIVIGHSFGGLLVQNLLGRNLAAAGIAIDAAPIKGVYELPLSALKSGFPALGNPFNYNKAVSLTEEEFRFGFTNAVPEDEAKVLYEKYAMPAPARPLFQVATAAFNPHAANKVDVDNNERGPLLLIAGESDHTVPVVLVKSALKNYHKSTAVTDFKEFEGRGHSLTIDHGWKELAAYSLTWLQSKGF